MMFVKFIPVCLTAVLAAVGYFCSRKDLRGVYCILFAAAVFCMTGCGIFRGYGFGGSETQTAEILGGFINEMPFDRLGSAHTSPAYMLIMKICAMLTDDPMIFVIVISALQAVLAAGAVYSVCGSPYESAVMTAGCFLLTTFVSSTVFTAGLICLFAAKYIKERRTVRFIALILAAACFDMSAALLIPLYFITIIPNKYICAGISAAAAVIASFFPETVSGVLTFLGGSTRTGFETPLPVAVISVAFALLCMLIYRMLTNREEKLGRLANTAVVGAAISAAAVSAPVLSAPALFLNMQAAVTLAPEIYAVGDKFVGIVFKDSEKAARITFGIVCAALVTGYCAYLVFENVYGSDFFVTAVIGEGML